MAKKNENELIFSRNKYKSKRATTQDLEKNLDAQSCLECKMIKSAGKSIARSIYNRFR